MQQRVGAVEEGDAVVGQIEDGDQCVRIDVGEVWPEEGCHQAVGSQEQGQRWHEAKEPAAVKAPVIQLAVLLELHQQQRCNQKAAEYKEQIDAEECTIKQGGVGMREDHQKDGYTSQPVERWVVAQLVNGLHQNRTPFLSPRQGPGLQWAKQPGAWPSYRSIQKFAQEAGNSALQGPGPWAHVQWMPHAKAWRRATARSRRGQAGGAAHGETWADAVDLNRFLGLSQASYAGWQGQWGEIGAKSGLC